jgi:DNA invertase Pin-like site-specific DNA recombinase
VSTDDQVDGTSLDTQEETCRRAAGENGLDVLCVFREEGASAKTARRPQLAMALSAAKQARATAFVVYKCDRLARNQTDHHAIRSRLASHGCRLVSATEHLADDPAGRLLEGMLAAVAQFDNDVRGERARAGMQSREARGGWVHRAPIGYMTTRLEDGTPSLAIDQERAPLVRHLLMDVAGGASQADALRAATAAGLRDAHGQPLSARLVVEICQRGTYAGMQANGQRGGWQPIIDEATWRKIQDRRTPHASLAAEFPWRGILRCSTCQRPMFGAIKQGIAYYWCRDRACQTKTIRGDRLEGAIEQALGEYQMSDAAWRALCATISARWRETREAATGERQTRQALVLRLEARRARLMDAMLDGLLDGAEYAERRAGIDRELTDARAADHDGADQMDGLQAAMEAALAFVRAPLAFYRQHPHLRERIAAILFSSGLYWSKASGLKWDKPLIFRQIASSLNADGKMACQMVEILKTAAQEIRALAALVEAA